MRAIYTKYIAPTDHRPARIKAYTIDGPASLTMPLDYDLDDVSRHETVARSFLVKHMPGCTDLDLTYGDAPKGYVFTFAISRSPMSEAKKEEPDPEFVFDPAIHTVDAFVPPRSLEIAKTYARFMLERKIGDEDPDPYAGSEWAGGREG